MDKIIMLSAALLLMAGVAFAGNCLEGNCQDGSGIFQWEDGSKFRGNFSNGAPDGEGIYTDPNGMDYTMLYKDGKPVSRPNPRHHLRPKKTMPAPQ